MYIASHARTHLKHVHAPTHPHTQPHALTHTHTRLQDDMLVKHHRGQSPHRNYPHPYALPPTPAPTPMFMTTCQLGTTRSPMPPSAQTHTNTHTPIFKMICRLGTSRSPMPTTEHTHTHTHTHLQDDLTVGHIQVTHANY